MSNINKQSCPKNSLFTIAIIVCLSIIVPIAIFITLGLLKDKICWTNEISLNEYFTSFIALCTTFIVGFQILNTLEWNNKFKELENDKLRLQEEFSKIKQISRECMYLNAYTIGKNRYIESKETYKSDKPFITQRYCWNAIRGLSNALLYAVDGGHNIKDAYNSFGSNILNCIDELSKIHSKTDKETIKKADNYQFPEYESRINILVEVYIALYNVDFKLKNNTNKDNIKIINDVNSLFTNWKDFSNKFYSEINLELYINEQK